MYQSRHFKEKRRSRLFDERPWIWGRLPKYLIAWCLSMQFWAGYYFFHRMTNQRALQEKTRKISRRTLPFIQAMEDIRFIAIQERNYMILKAVCDYEDPRMFDLFRSRYNQEDFFLSYYRGTTFRHYMDGRINPTRFFYLKANRVAEDENGLVGFNEQSTWT
mmetsp:Transcript_31108/g.30563  ORF Transcript_31108/g.30563 Transcript_31108/m.30563 type:complete len:162 (-) Transcript_31108:31-516(-)